LGQAIIERFTEPKIHLIPSKKNDLSFREVDLDERVIFDRSPIDSDRAVMTERRNGEDHNADEKRSDVDAPDPTELHDAPELFVKRPSVGFCKIMRAIVPEPIHPDDIEPTSRTILQRLNNVDLSNVAGILTQIGCFRV
jgi:hypothetical protein